MSQIQPSEVENDKPSLEQRLLIGIPVLVALLFLVTEVGWAVAGYPFALLTTRWLARSVALFASIFLAVFFILLAGAMLWGLGCLASMLGGVLIGAWHRWRHR